MTGPGFDERYDPRFQRGYDPGADASAGTLSAGSTPEEEPATAPVQPAATTAASHEREPREEAPAHRASAAAADAHGGTASTSSTSAASPEPGAEGGASETGADGARAELEGSSPELGEEPDRVRFWLGAVFGVCALAVGVAVAWLWGGYNEPAFFSGYTSRSAWDEMRWTTSLVLLEAAPVAAALVAIWLGMRQAARAADDRLHRLPAVIGLAAGLAAALLVVIWSGSGESQSELWAAVGAGPSMADEERSEMALAQLRSSLAGPAIRGGFAALIGILLIGARAAMGRRAAP
ncbi:hypothetical protein ACWKWP_01065 [Agromyces soli]